MARPCCAPHPKDRLAARAASAARPAPGLARQLRESEFLVHSHIVALPLFGAAVVSSASLSSSLSLTRTALATWHQPWRPRQLRELNR